MKAVLTIAGSDSGGGAGIQADIKTMTMNGVYAMSAVTALTAQNTLGVSGVLEIPPGFLAEQIDAVFSDIRPDAVKTGMVSSSQLIEVIAGKLSEYEAKNVVVDPVMISTSGSRLMQEEALESLKDMLLPLADVVTPNIPEAEVLAKVSIKNRIDMERAAVNIGERYGCAVVCKGGHSISDADDFLYDGERMIWFRGERINNSNTHGTGCTFSSAIASNLAKGFGLEESIERAKAYISGALASMLDLGRGSGPVDHAFDLGGRFSEAAK